MSTPLDNEFLHREEELQEIETKIANRDLLLLTGAAGVGKSKIALQAMRAFLEKNPSFSGIAVAKKDADISTDLRVHLEQNKDFILLVDDANRQLPNLKQILGVFREVRKGKIKLIITARDYAVGDIILECSEYAYDKVTLKKFTDEEITDILKSDSFEIKNWLYQKRIIALADGNARLAVMAARLAKEKNHEFLDGTIPTLYDEYFQTFIKDFDTLTNKTVLKTLGVLSFFFSIYRDDKKFVQELLERFSLDYYEFNDAIDELERRELIEVKYNVARVSEQVTATYFFNKVFIKDKFLSFDTLLFNYFPLWKRRFSDTVIPANNMFGYEVMQAEIGDTLDKFFMSEWDNEEKASAFISLFWFYKRDKVLLYFYQKISALPEPIDPVYSTEYGHNEHVWDDDGTLSGLSNFFAYETESFLPAIELAFEYCRKVSQKLPVLIRRIREHVCFDRGDERTDYFRQHKLFQFLTLEAKSGRPIYQLSFFALATTFLSHIHQNTRGERGHKISMYDYAVKNTDIIRAFRQNIWETLFELYPVATNEVMKVLESFKPGYRGLNSELLAFDLSLLVPFITKHFTITNFLQVYYVQELVRWLDKEQLVDRNYRSLKQKFISDEYKMFRKFDWSQLRGKEDYEFENNEEFDRLKEKDIRHSFAFTDPGDFPVFLKTITNALSVGENNAWSVVKSVDIVIEETFLKNATLGFKLLKALLADYPLTHYTLSRSIKTTIQASHTSASQLWEILQQWHSDYKVYWLLNFIDCLPDDLINEDYANKFIETVRSININATLNVYTLERFLLVKPTIIVEIVEIVSKKIEEKNLIISFWWEFYEKFANHFSNNLPLLEKLYLQQEAIEDMHDYKNKGLRAITELSPSFLLKYVKHFYATGVHLNRKDTHKSLAFVWDVLDSDFIEEAFNEVIDKNYYLGVGDFPAVIFFNDLEENQSTKAKVFMHEYITKHYHDRHKMNIVFDVLRDRLPTFVEEAFLHYLNFQTTVEKFSKIDWVGNPGVMNGDVIWGEINAARWQKVADMLSKHPNQLALIPIKAYIKSRIDNELKGAEGERMRRFLDPDW